MIRAYATQGANESLEPFEYDPGNLGRGQVEIDVLACGVCHSDLSVANNDWGFSQYPIVPGHEVVGTIGAVGEGVSSVKVGDTVGLGWFSASCMTCDQCMSGDHNLCLSAEQTIVGRYGGFANKVRCSAEWATLLPDGVDPNKAGPLFCGGITVFNPIVQFGVKPTDRVGVIGIGGLGHFALQFLNKWGCEVTAFTSTDAKRVEAKRMGAHHTVSSRNAAELAAVKGSFDFILSTVNVDLDWGLYWDALGPKGRLHTVGAAPAPIPAPAFTMITGQKSVSGTPLGSPATTRAMLDFCARHEIEAVTEHFPMSRCNDALEHLKSGKARYRVVLENDFA
ncbi:MAG: NAD(P)-dependent alcohol dehydrogenase [Deltaproteobacteria bacterium]|nr:NAD(P)-dependent alcohol dehydrogenase [Deltaproteobacteria bacterium]NND29486.1 NAD(P)-dependent alcohol dehydrogenase [Myxococcales bacterium]MBT8465792.1 NAD(P)-dependent alcohol dehydrogenase [Deltaproteobacteria bacterium]MBT8481060.1 NAD(P)-dependent alcohol dehydrogenase [Deltaproteobacteria bacterium]NNK07615.1 NAD(P)-dependent alcohol dehydrogenase [Myxococcales bacterium]